MKFNYKDKTVIVNLSHKTGVSTIINLLAYPITKYFGSKSQVRKKLKPEIYTLENKFDDADLKVAIVRDPIERIKSCYKDRIVVKNRDNLRDKVNTFTDFCNNFEKLYKEEYQIKLHSYPQVEALGKNPNYYDLIVSTKDINSKFKPRLEKLLDEKIPETKLNVSNSSDIIVTKDQIEYFKNFYKEDYKYYERYF